MKIRAVFLAVSVAIASAPTAAAPPGDRDKAIGAFFEAFARDWLRADPQRATALQYFEGAEQDALDVGTPRASATIRSMLQCENTRSRADSRLAVLSG